MSVDPCSICGAEAVVNGTLGLVAFDAASCGLFVGWNRSAAICRKHASYRSTKVGRENERSRTGIPAFGCFLAVEGSPCGESEEAFCEKRTGAREIVLFPEGFEEPSRLAYSERPPRGGGGGGGAPEFDIV